MSDWTVETLKEHLCSLRETDRRALELLADKLVETNDLKAKEIDRRLEHLNGAHQEALRVQNTYVRVESFDALKEVVIKLEKLVDVNTATRIGGVKSLGALFYFIVSGVGMAGVVIAALAYLN